MQKLTSFVFAAAAVLAIASPLAAQTRLSPHETVYVKIGNPRSGPLVSITYGRPFSIKPGTTEVRKIWGDLVKWGKGDRLGADEATLLLTQAPMVIGETTIQPGAYTLYIAASETGTSKLAFSTAIGKWGIPVDETHDLARFDLTKETLEKRVDQLTISLENVPTGGVIKIQWENTQFSLPFAIKK